MKYAILFMLFSSYSFAATVALPFGGKVAIDTKVWNIQDTKSITGTNVLFIAHKKETALQGAVLDGTIKEQGQCGQGKTMICERIVPMGEKVSYQVVGQRFFGKNAYQNYVFAFTFPKSQEKKYLPLLKSFKTQMEFVK